MSTPFCKVWSNNSSYEHHPAHIVMKKQSWVTGESVHVELVNSDNEVHAWYDITYEQSDENVSQ
jgi:hypothetical protein